MELLAADGPASVRRRFANEFTYDAMVKIDPWDCAPDT